MEQHTINCINLKHKQNETEFKRHRIWINRNGINFNFIINYLFLFIIMKDLLDYNRFRLEAMQDRICKLENHLQTLETYCFELADENCPREYKTIIKKELYNLKTK